jgi:ABC-type multidrug transport system ATPase subunit
LQKFEQEETQSAAMSHLPLLCSPTSVAVDFTGVCYSVAARADILDHVWGTLPAKSLTAIIGPSGAGKTTLLNILAARLSPTQGRFAVNGQPLPLMCKSDQLGFVEQEDVLWSTSSPRECLYFSARMRLPVSTSDEQCAALVEDMLVKLGLGKCQDTLVGTELERGLSGGEKKRVAVGIELISNPSLLFLDEPTSGLDSAAAFNIVALLRSLADDGCTCVATIHQPSSRVFFTFDHVILLGNGRTAYNGPAKALAEFLQAQGLPCPLSYSVSEHALDSVARLAPLPSPLDIPAAAAAARRAPDVLAPKATHLRVGAWKRCTLLVVREALSVRRNLSTLKVRFSMVVGLNVVLGLVLLHAGRASTKVLDVQTHFALLTLLSTGAVISMSNPIALTFPLERPILLRELAGGFYGVPLYFWSKFVVELAVCLVQSLLTIGIVFLMADMEGDLVLLWAVLSGLGLVASSVALLVSASVDSVKAAVSLNPVLVVPQLLFAGFVVPVAKIPVYLKWLTYVSQLRYAIALLVIAEFKHDPGASYVFVENEIEEDKWPVYVGILVANFVVFRGLAMYVLRKKVG